MRTPGLPRALLVVGGLALAVLAGIGTAGSFGGGGSLWGDYYESDSDPAGVDRNPTVLRAPAIRATIDSLAARHTSWWVDSATGSNARRASTEIQVLSPEWAVAYGTVTGDRDGLQPNEPTNRVDYLVLFEKTDGGWRVFREAASVAR